MKTFSGLQIVGWIQEKDVGTINGTLHTPAWWGDCNYGVDQRNRCVNSAPQLILQISWGGGWSRSRTESIRLHCTFCSRSSLSETSACPPAFTALLFLQASATQEVRTSSTCAENNTRYRIISLPDDAALSLIIINLHPVGVELISESN